jgi:hypothetical protein
MVFDALWILLGVTGPVVNPAPGFGHQLPGWIRGVRW